MINSFYGTTSLIKINPGPTAGFWAFNPKISKDPHFRLNLGVFSLSGTFHCFALITVLVVLMVCSIRNFYYISFDSANYCISVLKYTCINYYYGTGTVGTRTSRLHYADELHWRLAGPRDHYSDPRTDRRAGARRPAETVTAPRRPCTALAVLPALG